MAFEGPWDDHPEAKREVAAAVSGMDKDYELPVKTIVLRDGEEFGQMAGKSNDRLYFSPRFGDPAAFAAWQKELGPALVGVEREDVVIHELAHMLEGSLTGGMAVKDRKAWGVLMDYVREPVTYKVGGKDVTSPRWSAGNLEASSPYASESPFEFIAEGFSDWRKNGDEAKVPAQEIGRQMDAVMRR